MSPTPLTATLSTILALQLLLLAGCSAVLVERVGLDDDATYATVQSPNATVFACHYKLQRGETLDEVVWVFGGRLIHSYMPTDSRPAEAEVSDVNKFELSNIRRSKAGIYKCTARTKEGTDSSGKFELFVADIPEREFKFSTSTKKCVYNISLETPAAYPTMTAFCGVWVNRTAPSGQLGYWLEPPPERAETNEVLNDDDAAGSLRTLPKLSYSTERGDFSKISYDDERTGFQLHYGTIRVDDTPEDSFIRCFTGFYKKSGTFLTSNSIETHSTDYSTVKCSNITQQQFTNQYVTLKCSNCEDACRGNIKPRISTLPLTVTIRCSKNQDYRKLECRQDEWMLDEGHGAFKKDFQDDLLNFAETCEKGEVIVSTSTEYKRGEAGNSGFLADGVDSGAEDASDETGNSGTGAVTGLNGAWAVILLAIACACLQLLPTF